MTENIIQYENPATPTPPNAETLISRLYAVRQAKSAAEKSEEEILAQLKPMVDPELDSAETPSGILDQDNRKTVKLIYGTHELARIPGTNRTIKADKLLEKGVSPEIVDYATDTVPYFQYRVKPLKQEQEGDEG